MDFSFLPVNTGYLFPSLIYFEKALWICIYNFYSFDWYEVTQTTAFRLLLLISLLTHAKKRGEGKPHRVAITHVAKKLIRVIYALESQDIDFNAQELR